MASRLSLPKKANGGKPKKKPKKAKAKGEWQTEKARWLPKKAMANGNSKKKAKSKAKAKAKAKVNALDEFRTVTLNAVKTLSDGLDFVRLDATKAAKILSNRIDAVNTSLNTMDSSHTEVFSTLDSSLTHVEDDAKILKLRVTALECMVWTLKDNVEFLTDRVAALERWPYWDDEKEGAEAVDRTDAA